MTIVISAALLLACTVSLESQIIASLNRSSGGFPEVRIRNTGALSLAAFAVAMNPVAEAEDRTQFVVFLDAVVDGTTPLEPNEERSVPVPFRSRPGKRVEDLFQTPMIAAGILAGGTTEGDAVLLMRLMLRRSNMLLALDTTLEALSHAGRRNVPRDQLISQFHNMAESVWRWYVPPEQQVGRPLYQSIVGKLRSLPDGPVGSPFPPTAFVANEAAALNRKRVVILESKPSLATATFTRAQ